jgi:hypothetical protein
MKYSDILETRLAKLPPQERKRVQAVGRRMAKRRLAKMLDQGVKQSKHQSKSTLRPARRISKDNVAHVFVGMSRPGD